jgi:cytidylate kinase
MADNIVIAINREYGSGGKTIGEMLSRELGIHYYDKEILHLAADVSGINEALFVVKDEDTTARASLFRAASKVYTGELIAPGSRDFTSEQNLFNYQAKIIRALADEESCIIIGRCGDYVLGGRENLIRVFIYASPEYCLEQAKKRGAFGGKTTMKFIQETNRYRAEYYKYYTGHDWNDCRNYDLCLNSGAIGFQGCVDAIKEYIRIRFPGYQNDAL